MTLLVCAFLLALAALAFDRTPRRTPESLRAAPWRALCAIAIALAASLVANEALVTHAALTQRPFPDWLRAARFVPILELEPLYAHTPPAVSLAAEALALLDAALLAALAYVLRGVALRGPLVAFAFAATGALIAIAFFARGLASSDLYAYALYARFGTGAYHSIRVPTDGPLAIVGHLWAFRMLPGAYGPVWLDLARVVAGGIASIDVQILALRALSALSLLALVGGLVASRVPAAFVMLVALDPAIDLQFVVDGHNDLFGIALLVWARVAARRGAVSSRVAVRAVAVVLASLAGASKASFLPLAALAFFDAPTRVGRLVPAACAVAGGLGLSLALGGLAYPRAILDVAAIFPASSEPGGAFVPHLTTLATVALVVAAVGFRKTGWPGSWAFVSLGSVVFPWYAIWGIVYASLDGRRAGPFLVSFPVTAFALTTTYSESWAWAPLMVSTACAAAVLAYARWRSPARRWSTRPVPSA